MWLRHLICNPTPPLTHTHPLCSKLPFEPLSVTFKDICYDVPRPKSATGVKANDPEVDANTLRLLRHVNGAFRPGVSPRGASRPVSRLLAPQQSWPPATGCVLQIVRILHSPPSPLCHYYLTRC